MAFDLAAANAILKEDYQDMVAEQLNNDNPVAFRLAKNKKQAQGKRFFLPLHYGRNNGIGYRAEGGTLPNAGNQQYKESTATCAYVYGSIEITGPTIAETRNNKGAFIQAVDSEMKGLLKDLKNQRARAIFGDGTGKLATFAVNTAVTTLTVDFVRYFEVGMIIDIMNSGGGVSVAGRTITAIDKVAKTISISGANVTTANTDFAVITGDYNLEAMGLGGIMSDTLTLQGLAPATYSWWKPSVLANGGTPRAISQALMRQAMDFAEIEGGDISLISTSYGVRAALEALMQQNVRFVKPMTLEGGFSALEYDGMPIITDRFHTSKTMYFIDEDEIDLYQLADFQWMQDDKGGVLFPNSIGATKKDSYGATMYAYETLVTYQRNSHAVLKDIIEAAGY